MKNKKKLFSAITICVVLSVVITTCFIVKKPVKSQPISSTTITVPSDNSTKIIEHPEGTYSIMQPTLADTEATEVSKDNYGREYVVNNKGKFMKTGDNLIKLPDKIVVPYVGKWYVNSGNSYYQINEDGTFVIANAYTNKGKTQYTYYSGKYNILKNGESGATEDFYYKRNSKLLNNHLPTALSKLGEYPEYYVPENLYYIEMYYTTITNTENNNVFTAQENEFSLDNPMLNFESFFEGLIYTKYDEMLKKCTMHFWGPIEGEKQENFKEFYAIYRK